MPIETLKTNYPASTPHFVSGETLNRYNNAINALTRGKTGLHAAGVKVDLPPVPFIFGIAEITDASNACPQADYEQGSDAPCFSQNRYLARFRYYNFDDQEWVEIEEDLRLDASGWFEPVVTDAGPASSGPGYGAIPTFVKGDVINAYFDVNRNWLIPVCTPPADPPMGEFYTSDAQTIDQNGDVDAVVLEAYLEIFRPGIDEDFFPVAGVSFPMMSVGGGTTFDSRCTFTNIACTSGTQVRVRATRGAHETTGATVQVYFSTIKFTGTGRRNSQAVSDPPTYDAYEGGKTILGWQASASTQGRYKDSPTFVAVDALNAFRVGYFDPLDQWIVGIELFVVIKVVEGDENSSSSSSSSLSSTSSSSTSSSSSSSSSTSLSSSSSTSSQSSQSSSLSSSSSSTSTLSSSSSQSLSTSSQTMSTSSSSQSVSESSSSSADCVRFVEKVCFDTVTCTLTVTYGEFCIPRGSGITVSHDVEGPTC